MARMIFFCTKCNSTYGADAGTTNNCPDCQIPLLETNRTTIVVIILLLVVAGSII